MIKESDPHIMVKLYNGTWVHYIPLPFLEDDNITAPLKKGGRGSGCFTAEETSCTNASITFLNVDKVTFILKAMHVAVLVYLLLKELLTTIIPIYSIFCQSNTCMDT